MYVLVINCVTQVLFYNTFFVEFMTYVTASLQKSFRIVVYPTKSPIFLWTESFRSFFFLLLTRGFGKRRPREEYLWTRFSMNSDRRRYAFRFIVQPVELPGRGTRSGCGGLKKWPFFKNRFTLGFTFLSQYMKSTLGPWHVFTRRIIRVIFL